VTAPRAIVSDTRLPLSRQFDGGPRLLFTVALTAALAGAYIALG